MADAHEEEVLGKAYDSRLMKRLLGYLRPYRKETTVALFAIISKSMMDVVGPYLTKTAVDRYLVQHGTKSTSLLDPWLPENAWNGIALISGLYIGTMMISFLFEFVETYLMQWVGQKAMFDLRTQIFGYLQQMHIGFYDKNPVGRLVTRVTTDVDALNEMFTAGVVSIFEDIFVLTGIIFIMMRMNWQLALISFAVLPLIFLSTLWFRKVVRDSYRRIRTAIARINSYLQEHISGMVVLQLFNREARSATEFDTVNAQHKEAFKDAILAHAIYYPVVEIFSALAISCVLWFGGLRSINGTVSLGVLVAFMQYAQRFFRPIQDLSEKYNILQGAMASSERVFKLLDTPIEVRPPQYPNDVEGPGSIEFDHVSFAYQTRKIGGKGMPMHDELDWVIRDVSFSIKPGETIAVVGHTGAGKTTMISLLMRFYDVQRGSIKIDGVDIRQMTPAILRRRFGVVLQDPFLFTGTIEENIRLGTAWIGDRDIKQAADLVNLGEFIESLPEGYRSVVRERGASFSTGQKQLISFARALAHNPRILILDEATSSVDTETEMKVREALNKMVEGRTSFIIAHRLSTIQKADRIFVMHKGQLREQGSHQQLLAQRGIYWKLYQLQYKDQEMATSA